MLEPKWLRIEELQYKNIELCSNLISNFHLCGIQTKANQRNMYRARCTLAAKVALVSLPGLQGAVGTTTAASGTAVGACTSESRGRRNRPFLLSASTGAREVSIQRDVE